jgi:hypothetical protein
VEYLNYLGSMITNYVKLTREVQSRIATAKAASRKNKTLFSSKLGLNLRNKPVKCYIWSGALYGAQTLTLRKVDEKYPGSFLM